ncbi:hypothetical protein J6590_049987 [Homalodisca vitripennis]|nr:hypothetical protein J6590_049987 [Homalodisca vitripennis]
MVTYETSVKVFANAQPNPTTPYAEINNFQPSPGFINAKDPSWIRLATYLTPALYRSNSPVSLSSQNRIIPPPRSFPSCPLDSDATRRELAAKKQDQSLCGKETVCHTSGAHALARLSTSPAPSDHTLYGVQFSLGPLTRLVSPVLPPRLRDSFKEIEGQSG